MKKRLGQNETGREWDTETSVIILMCGTTGGWGSAVWGFENKSFLTQENQMKGNPPVAWKNNSLELKLWGNSVQVEILLEANFPTVEDKVKHWFTKYWIRTVKKKKTYPNFILYVDSHIKIVYLKREQVL